MFTLPEDMFALLAAFVPLFSRRVWRYVPVLVVGALLAPGRRMVSTALRTVGLGQTRRFQNYHRVLSRAIGSSRKASRILLGLLVVTFVPAGPLVLGIDETIERRRGAKIAAAGIYRDPVRSSRSHFVKVNGLRWICLMLLAPIPWAGRVWALPFLTALAPSERYAQQNGRRHKPITLWARQLVRQVRRWLPERQLVLVLWQQLCRPRPAGSPASGSDRRHASAPGCAALCSCPAAPSPPEGPPPPGRPTAAHARTAQRRLCDRLGPTDDRPLVWPAGPRGRGRL